MAGAIATIILCSGSAPRVTLAGLQLRCVPIWCRLPTIFQKPRRPAGLMVSAQMSRNVRWACTIAILMPLAQTLLIRTYALVTVGFVAMEMKLVLEPAMRIAFMVTVQKHTIILAFVIWAGRVSTAASIATATITAPVVEVSEFVTSVIT